MSSKRPTPARDLAQIAVFAALIITLGLPGQISVGSSGVPITLQTLGVMLAGALLGLRKGALSVTTVIVLGFALPVLAGGRTTLTSLAGPTVGFLLGWLPAVAVIGWLSARMLPRYRLIPGVAINVLGGIVVLYVFGIAGMVLRTDLTVWAAVVANGTFLPGDLLKAVVAAAVAAQVHRTYPALLVETGSSSTTRAAAVASSETAGLRDVKKGSS